MFPTINAGNRKEPGMTMYICQEMKKLRTYLDEHKIKWSDESDRYMCRTRFLHNKNTISVVNGFGSYGGIGIDADNRGFLEVWGKPFGKYPVGYLTAENIIATIWGKG